MSSSIPPTTPTPIPSTTNPSSTETKLHSRTSQVRTNLSYLIHGPQSTARPADFRTRSVLNTTRYVLKYLVRRGLRYAKYAAVGAIVTVLGTGLLGTLTSISSIFILPTGLTGIGLGLGFAVLKFSWRHRPSFLRFGGGFTHDDVPSTKQKGFLDWARDRANPTVGTEGGDPVRDEERDLREVERERKRENKKVRQDVWMRA